MAQPDATPGVPVHTPCRLHVIPLLRRPGRLLLPEWLAITLGRHIFSWRPLDEPELAHELAHVRQWERYGVRFVPRYLRASWRAMRAGGDRYRDNAFEREARSAARRVLAARATATDRRDRATTGAPSGTAGPG